MFTPPIYGQDVRDLVLHAVADAPPPNWVRVEVRLLSSLSPPIDTRPERAVHTKSRHTVDTRHTPRLSRPPPTAHLSLSQPSHPDRDTAPRRVKNVTPVHRLDI
jgi:hypothetical protein